MVSLFDENLPEEILSLNKNITVISPDKISADNFVEALDIPRKFTYTHSFLSKKIHRTHVVKVSLLSKLIFYFICYLLLFISYVHFKLGFDFIESTYKAFYVTFGFGDVDGVLFKSRFDKIVGIIVIVSSSILISAIAYFLGEKLIKRISDQSQGRKKYHMKDHIILIGLGRLGYYIAEKLLARGEKIIIIEKEQENDYISYFRSLGVPIFTGDASNVTVLEKVSIKKAKALIVTIDNDLFNMNIAKNARNLQPDLRLILRIYEKNIAQKISEILGIEMIISTSEVVSEKIVNHTEK